MNGCAFASSTASLAAFLALAAALPPPGGFGGLAGAARSMLIVYVFVVMVSAAVITTWATVRPAWSVIRSGDKPALPLIAAPWLHLAPGRAGG